MAKILPEINLVMSNKIIIIILPIRSTRTNLILINYPIKTLLIMNNRQIICNEPILFSLINI